MKNKYTLKSIFEKSVEYLSKYEIPDPKTDVKYLLSHILNYSLSDILKYENKTLSYWEVYKLKKFLKRRKNKEPIAYITGHKEFFGLDFFVTKDILIPRPETEFIVEEILNLKLRDFSLLDIGCGSGVIGITIKKILQNVKVTMTDVSNNAIKIARKNAKVLLGNNNIKFIKSDMFKNIVEKFDVIVSNPPYIKKNNIKNLMEDVKNFEPIIALNGGADGLKFYKIIIENSKYCLKSGGYLLLELNPFLTEEVKMLLKENNFNVVKIVKDYAGLNRVVIASI